MNKTVEITNPWTYFDIPKEDLHHLQKEYGAMMGANVVAIALSEKRGVERILHPAEAQNMNNKNTWDLHSEYAIKLARLALIASFLSQFYHPYKPNFTLELLPADVKKYFRYPYSDTRDYNPGSLIAWKQTLPPKYQSEVFTDGR